MSLMALVLAVSSQQYGVPRPHYGAPQHEISLHQVESKGLGAVLAAILATKSFKIGFLKGLLFKPVALLVLAKLKVALILGKPLALLVLKKLLLKTLLGGLLLKVPLILLAKKVLLAKVLAVKFALVAKGLIGLKAPIILLFLAAAALGKGTGIAAILGKFNIFHEEDEYEDYSYEDYSPPAAYGQPIYTPQIAAPQFASSALPQLPQQPQAQYLGRKKRFVQFRDDSSEESGEEEQDEDSEEQEGDALVDQFEAARTNGDSYLLMASQFDDKSCGHRLICEVYQKPRSGLTDNEILLQELFGYPLAGLSQNEVGTARGSYHRAALLGQSANGRHNVCHNYYPKCGYSAGQLVDIFINNQDIDTNEIGQGRPIFNPNAAIPQSTPARRPFLPVQQLQRPQTLQQQRPLQQKQPVQRPSTPNRPLVTRPRVLQQRAPAAA